jgi:ABC-type Na+ efflux pump permease subunit
LLTTELTDREIVWGKVAARVLLVLSAVAAGVPVLFLTLLFGEPDFQFLAAGYALAAGTAVLCVAIGVSAACHAPDSRTALIRAYAQSAALVGALLVPPFVLFSPFAMLLYCRMDFASESLRVMFGFGYPAGQVVIAWVLMVEATRNLRRAGPMAGPPEPTAFPEPPRGRPLPVLLTPPAEPIVLPPIGRIDPVLWKERHTGRPSPRSALDTPARCLGAFIGLLAVALFVTGGWGMLKRALRAFDPHEAARLERRGPGPPDRAPAALVAAGVLAAGLCLVPLAVGVTGCVAGERQRATLESLLATTLGRRRLLWSKVRAHVERTLVFAVGAIAALGSGFGVDGGWRFGLAAAAAFAGGLVLVLGYGAWLSVRCETPARAFRLCLPAVALTVALPVIVWSFTEWTDTAPPTRVLAYVAAASAVVGGLFLWRAGAELESGE